MTNHQIFYLILLFLAGALSFLLSGMETGVLALSRLRIRQLKKKGNKRAEVLHNYLENPERFLWTILIGNTVANFVVLCLGAMAIYRVLWEWPLGCVLVFIAAVFLFYTLCELLPKMLFRLFPNRLSLFLARPFRLIDFIFAPLVAVVAWFSRTLLRWTGNKKLTGHLFGNRDELRFLMQESSNVLTSEEKQMINRVLDLQTLTVRQMAFPMSDSATVRAETPFNEVLELCRKKRFTRLPVWKKENGRDRIVGVISLKTLLYLEDRDSQKPVGDYVKPALFLDENLRAEEALRRMQRSGQRLAIVLGNDQREIGLLSLQDILKSIFGEVRL